MLQTVVTKGNVALDSIDFLATSLTACDRNSEIVNSGVSDSELFEVQLSVLLVAHIPLTR
jgi:hypothetical protein